eukprot:243927_1
MLSVLVEDLIQMLKRRRNRNQSLDEPSPKKQRVMSLESQSDLEIRDRVHLEEGSSVKKNKNDDNIGDKEVVVEGTHCIINYKHPHNLSYDGNYCKYLIKSNAESLNVVSAFCRVMEQRYGLSMWIPHDVIETMTTFCFHDTFDIDITDTQLLESVRVHSGHTIATASTNNVISTLYGSVIVNAENNMYAWTLRRNKFTNINRNFFFGIIRNDIESLYEHIHNVGWTASAHGYYMDLISLMTNSRSKSTWNHDIDMKVQITLNVKQGLLYFYLLIDGRIVNHYKVSRLPKSNYRLAICLVGEGTEIEIC